MTYVRQVLLVALAVLVAFALYHRQDALSLFNQELAELDRVRAVIFFFIAFLVGALLLIPASVFIIAAGAIFGFHWGYLLGMLGFTCSALCTFLCSRYLVRNVVGRYLPGRMLALISNLHQHGWKLVAILRLLGVIPASVVSYALGITRIGIWEYTWASCVFTMPIGLILAYAGSAGKEFIESGDLTTLILALTLLTLIGLAIFLLRRWYLKKQKLPGI